MITEFFMLQLSALFSYPTPSPGQSCSPDTVSTKDSHPQPFPTHFLPML